MSGPSTHAARALVKVEPTIGNAERIARAVAERTQLRDHPDLTAVDDPRHASSPGRVRPAEPGAPGGEARR